MTRINCVPVEELCNQHLHAEWREMPRVVGNLTTSLARKSRPFNASKEIPKNFVLGTGHVKFFYDKLAYLDKRHKLIVAELIKRGYNLSEFDENHFRSTEAKWYNDWEPSEDDIELSRSRIRAMMPDKPLWRCKNV